MPEATSRIPYEPETHPLTPRARELYRLVVSNWDNLIARLALADELQRCGRVWLAEAYRHAVRFRMLVGDCEKYWVTSENGVPEGSFARLRTLKCGTIQRAHQRLACILKRLSEEAES